MINLTSTATRLISQFGRPISISRVTDPEYSVTDAEVTGSIKKFSAYGVSIDDMKGLGDKADTEHLTLYINAGTYNPEEGDIITWNSSDLIIRTVKSISPSGVDQVYEVKVSR